MSYENMENQLSMSQIFGFKPLQMFAEDNSSNNNNTGEPNNTDDNGTNVNPNQQGPNTANPPADGTDNQPAGGDAQPSKKKVDITPEIAELLEEARRQEKAKQYATIEAQKRENVEIRKQLEAALAEMENLKKQIAELNTPANLAPVNSISVGVTPVGENNVQQNQNPVQPQNLVQAQNQVQTPVNQVPPVQLQPTPQISTTPTTPAPADDKLQKLESIISQLVSQVETVVKVQAQRDAEAARAALEQYKTQAIAAAQIPAEFASLITGDTKEAIDAAINTVKNGLAKIAPSPAPARSGSFLTASVRLPGAPANANIQVPEITPETINNMTLEEYKRFREMNPHMFGGSQRYGYQGFGGAGLRRQ